jgi:hypothetical protein
LTDFSNKVTELLNKSNIKVTSVDFTCFAWVNKDPIPSALLDEEPNLDQEIIKTEEDKNKDKDKDSKDEGSINEDSNNTDEINSMSYNDIPTIQPVEQGTHHMANPTIWIGVLPGTLTAGVAQESSNNICAFLDPISGLPAVNIAYWELICTPSARTRYCPALLSPAKAKDPLKEVIHNVSTSVGIPVAGMQIPDMLGTLGPHFRVSDTFYAISARHNCFPHNGHNDGYRHNSTS